MSYFERCQKDPEGLGKFVADVALELAKKKIQADAGDGSLNQAVMMAAFEQGMSVEEAVAIVGGSGAKN